MVIYRCGLRIDEYAPVHTLTERNQTRRTLYKIHTNRHARVNPVNSTYRYGRKNFLYIYIYPKLLHNTDNCLSQSANIIIFVHSCHNSMFEFQFTIKLIKRYNLSNDILYTYLRIILYSSIYIDKKRLRNVKSILFGIRFVNSLVVIIEFNKNLTIFKWGIALDC